MLPKKTKTVNNINSANSNVVNNAINPWTNKYKQRGEGLLNSIISKHLNDQQEYDIINNNKQNTIVQQSQQNFIKLAEQISKRDQVKNNIDENLKQVFNIKTRSLRIDEILEWVEKIQQRSTTNKNQLQQSNLSNRSKSLSPIDSSFVYLPAYSGTTLHEILEDCLLSSMGKQKNIGQVNNIKLKQMMNNIKNMEDLSKKLEQTIL